MSDSLAVIWSIGRKDLLLELRNKDVVVAVAGVGATAQVLASFRRRVSTAFFGTSSSRQLMPRGRPCANG